MELKDIYEHMAVVDIECYERRLVVFWDAYISEKKITDLLEARYEQWVHVSENPEVEDYCCEEWILLGLDEIGLDYLQFYINKEVSDARRVSSYL